MTLRTALDQLAALTLPGVTSFDIDSTPQQIERAHLPALLILPLRTDQRQRLGERDGALQTITFGAGERHVLMPITHLLLIAPQLAGSGNREHLPVLVDWVDDYLAAIAADLTLGGELLQAPQIEIEMGVFTIAQTRYIGCAFHYRLPLMIGA